MSETKKRTLTKTRCHNNRSSRAFPPKVLFRARETKVLGTSFPPLEVIIHELFKPTTLFKLF